MHFVGTSYNSGQIDTYPYPGYTAYNSLSFVLDKNVFMAKKIIATLNFNGYVDDYLEISLNNAVIKDRQAGAWKKCSNWNDITCSPILSPLTLEINPIEGTNVLKFRAYSPGGFVWLYLKSVSVDIIYSSE